MTCNNFFCLQHDANCCFGFNTHVENISCHLCFIQIPMQWSPTQMLIERCESAVTRAVYDTRSARGKAIYVRCDTWINTKQRPSQLILSYTVQHNPQTVFPVALVHLRRTLKLRKQNRNVFRIKKRAKRKLEEKKSEHVLVLMRSHIVVVENNSNRQNRVLFIIILSTSDSYIVANNKFILINGISRAI